MKGTVPHNDQPVVTGPIKTAMNVETLQQVTVPGRSKVKTSAAFLGLAIASGLLFPEGGSAATEPLTADPTQAMQSSSNQAAGAKTGDSVSDSSDWQPSILRNLTESNSGSIGSTTEAEPEVVKDYQETETQAQEQTNSGPVVVSEPPSSKSLDKSFSWQSETVESNNPTGGDNSGSNATESLGSRLSKPSQTIDIVRESVKENEPSSLHRTSGTLVIESNLHQSVSVVYNVSSGDTIAQIAKAHGVSVDAIIQANKLIDPNLISVNQELRIPKPLANYLGNKENDSYQRNNNSNSKGFNLGESQPLKQDNSPGASVRLRLSQTINPSVIPSQLSEEITKPVGLKFDSNRSGASENGSDRISTTRLSELAKGTPRISTEPIKDRDSTTASDKGLSASEYHLLDADVKQLGAENQNLAAIERKPTTKLYTDRLRTEVERLRNEYHAKQLNSAYSYQTVKLSQEPEKAIAESPTTEIAATPRPDPRRANRINPEFNPRAYEPRKDTEKGEIPDQQNQQLARLFQEDSEYNPDSVVATAPLGASAYDPLQNPTMGRIVSPDLPPLLGPDAYLPGGSPQFNGFIWPAEGVFTSGYGWRWGRMHRGIDIAGPVGTPILAAAPGVVIYAGWNSGGYGNLVELEHPDGSITLYAHNHRIMVNKGQKVTQGQLIAEMGSTGFSTGPHLHFEIHPSGQGATNPMALLPKN